jgi:WD40 repeat protein
MSGDPEHPETPPEVRRATQFGRNAIVRPKPRRQILWGLGAAAGLAIIAAAVAAFWPSASLKSSLGWDWYSERREVQKQRENEEELRRIGQARKEMEAQQQEPRNQGEAALKELNMRMQSPPQALPQVPQAPQEPKEAQETQEQTETQAEERQAAVKPDEDKAAPEPQKSLGAHSDAVVWLSVSPEGTRILSASTDRSIKLWDVKTGSLVTDVGRHADMARAALFVPGGNEVVTGADDGVINIWSLDGGKPADALDAKEHGGVRGLALSADGRLAASSHDSGTIVVWGLEERRKLHVMNGHQWSTNAVAVSPDGKLVVSGDIDGVIRTWDAQTGKSLRLWKGHERGVYGAAFLPGGGQVVTASGDGMLKLWNVENGREVRSFPGHAATVYAVSVSADGKRMLSGSLDATARLWNLATGEEIAYFDNSGSRIYAVALLDDGSVAIGDESGAIKIMAANGGAVRTLAAETAR